jgi:6-phosphofructokinase
MTPEGRQMAYETLVANDIDALVVIGGNGTLAEQHALWMNLIFLLSAFRAL